MNSHKEGEMPTVRKVTTTETQTDGSLGTKVEVLEPGATEYDTLADFMDSCEKNEWQRTTLYLYQIDPPVTKYPGQHANVKGYKELFDEEEVRRVAPDGRYFMIIEKINPKPGEKPPVPRKFFFALTPRPQPTVAVAGPAQVAVSGTDAQALRTIDKLSSAGIDQVSKAAEKSTELLGKTFELAMARAISQGDQKNVDPVEGFTKLLGRLREDGFLIGKPQGTDADAIVAKLKAEGVLATQQSQDLVTQLSKLAEAAALMGYTRSGAAAAEETFKILLTRNAPAIINGLNLLADRILAGLTMRWQMAAQAQPTAPTEAPPGPEQAAATEPTRTAAPPRPPRPVRIPGPQEVLDGFVKSKLVEMYANKIEPDEAVGWLEIAAPEVIQTLGPLEVESLIIYLRSDPILAPLGQDEARPWVESFLKEINAPEEGGKS
jgi:hypothetical protein